LASSASKVWISSFIARQMDVSVVLPGAMPRGFSDSQRETSDAF
jgi:hypothetical protein